MADDGFAEVAERLRDGNAECAETTVRARTPAPLDPIAPLLDDEREIPPRRWSGGAGAFPRPKITVVSGSPGVSKTTVVLEIAMGIAAGVTIENLIEPIAPERVLFGLIEDDADEAHRRTAAVARAIMDAPHQRALVNRNLRLVDLSDMVPFFTVTPEGHLIETEGFKRLCDTIAEFRPDVVVLDPLIELHTAEENSNSALRPVLRRLRQLAAHPIPGNDHDLALLLIHHETKSSEGTALQRLRGGGGIGGAIRSLLSLRPMNAEEAKEYGVAEDMMDLYIRVETGKQQYARKQRPRWLVTEERELANGDRAHLLLPWNPPSATITPDMLAAAVAALRAGYAGEPCSKSPRSDAFYGLAFEARDIPRSLRGKVLDQLLQDGEAEWRQWSNPDTRKKNSRLWVARNGFGGWQE